MEIVAGIIGVLNDNNWHALWKNKCTYRKIL